MRFSIIMSMALHVLVFFVSLFGLPYIQLSPAMEELPMVVELVSIASETNLPPKPEVKSKLKKLKGDPPPSNQRLNQSLKI